MNDQLSIQDEITQAASLRRDRGQAHARVTDPETSKAAARSVEPSLRESQTYILGRLQTYGPMTDTKLVEIATGFGSAFGILMSESGIRTRRRELVDLGLVYDTGKRVTLPSGRKAIVWAAKEK